MAPLTYTSALPRHFLFMLPASTTQAERSAVVESARRLTALGYVYIASFEEKTMEDREEIRYLPLNLEVLPCFGSVTAVCVLRDESIAEAARSAYPGTEVLVVDPLAESHAVSTEKSPSIWLGSNSGDDLAISQAA